MVPPLTSFLLISAVAGILCRPQQSCTLRPEMQIENCITSASEDQVKPLTSAASLGDLEEDEDGDDVDAFQVIVEISRDGDDMQVVHGTVCRYLSSTRVEVSLKCQQGLWARHKSTQQSPPLAFSRKKSTPTVHSKNELRDLQEGKELPREKRASEYNTKTGWRESCHCQKQCSGILWWRRCPRRCTCRNIPNRYPYFSNCPDINNNQYLEKGETTKVVSWSNPVAHDPEDGNRPVQQTRGPSRGSRLGVGYYSITYRAADKYGLDAYCKREFRVLYRTCSSYTYLRNGKVTCTDSNRYGSICTATCNAHYERAGVASRECGRDGKWSNVAPNCKVVSCKEPTSVADGSWASCSNHNYGTTCVLACKSGFKVEGETKITCQADKTWSTAGTCKDIQAPDITCPNDVTMTSAPKMQPVAVSWDSPIATDNSGKPVVVTADHTSGQPLDIGQTIVTFTATDQTGNVKTCTMMVIVNVKRCSVLDEPEYGQWSCSHENAVGSFCTISCSDGFLISGSTTQTCQDDQQWSGSESKCQRGSCGSPPVVQHGKYKCQQGTKFEDQCTLQCSSSFEAHSPLQVTCGNNLQWTPAGYCRDNQAPKFPNGCPDVLEYAAMLNHETYVSYSLPMVSDNSGRVTVQGEPGSGAAFVVGSTNVTFTAEDPSGNKGVCVMQVTVKPIVCPNPESAGIDKSTQELMQFNCPHGFVYGAFCDVSCSDNRPVQGADKIQCSRKGTHQGHWTHTGNMQPYCHDEACPKVTVPEFGAVACSEVADTETCTVHCQNKTSYYVMGNDNGYFFCSKTIGKWIPDLITKHTCKRGRYSPSGILQFDMHYYSTDCSHDNEEIRNKFYEVIKTKPIFQQACQQEKTTCGVDKEDIKVNCRSDRKKKSVNSLLRRKRSIGTSHIVEVTCKVRMEGSEDITKDREQLFKRFGEEINDYLYKESVNNGLTLPDSPDLQVDSYSFGYGSVEMTCPAPTVLSSRKSVKNSLLCVNCGEGYVYDISSQSCAACSLGTYSSVENATECVSCPESKTTQKTASKSEDDCIDICYPGHFSKTGFQPCEACAIGTYQSLTGKAGCDLCPYGTSTLTEGATSKDDCISHEVTLKADNPGPSIDFGASSVTDFFVVAWVKVPSDLVNTDTTFSLDQTASSASIGCEQFKVYIDVNSALDKMTYRQWYHVAMVKIGSMLQLYVDGNLVSEKAMSSYYVCTEKEINFVPSDHLMSLTLSDIQMSSDVISEGKIKSLAKSCSQDLENTIDLITPEEAAPLITPSTCDAINNCADSPCGEHGKCIDKQDNYTCECTGLWTGPTCQKEPDFCIDHQCANGAECFSDLTNETYTCICATGFRGQLCTEKIIHGGWSQWSDFSVCPVSCGGSKRWRSRKCNNPKPGPDGNTCVGEDEEEEACNTNPCPIDGGLSDWSAWICDVTCGNGTSERTRMCNNPAPAHGGQDCSGNLIDVLECSRSPCPVDGGWSDWTLWSKCTEDCGGGLTTRNRTCDSPAPAYEGNDCEGEDAEEKVCNEEECPSCPVLKRKSSHRQIVCQNNETADLNVCTIECERGFVMENDTYSCGPASNYVWSHVTEDNPDGKLPDCTKAELPQKKSLKVSGTVENVPTDSSTAEAVSQQMGNNLKNSVTCVSCNASASYMVTHSDKKYAVQSITVNLELTFDTPGDSIDLSVASDQELDDLMDGMEESEKAFQDVAQASSDIFTAQYKGQVYQADVDSISGDMTIQCPRGTQEYSGLCVKCGGGTYWSDGKCLFCLHGEYQDQVGMTYCFHCPMGFTTSGLGSDSEEDCTKVNKAESNSGSEDISLPVTAIVGICIGLGLAFVMIVVIIVYRHFKISQQKFSPSKELAQLSEQGDHMPPSYEMITQSTAPPISHEKETSETVTAPIL